MQKIKHPLLRVFYLCIKNENNFLCVHQKVKWTNRMDELIYSINSTGILLQLDKNSSGYCVTANNESRTDALFVRR